MRATGGTLTSLAESGTGTLAGEAQMEVFRTLAKAEAVKISEVISKQFVNRWLERLYPGKPRLVYWSMDAEDEKAKSANVDKITKMAAVGYRAEDEEVSEMTGMRVTYREPVLQSMGTPGLPLPLIRNRARRDDGGKAAYRAGPGSNQAPCRNLHQAAGRIRRERPCCCCCRNGRPNTRRRSAASENGQ